MDDIGSNPCRNLSRKMLSIKKRALHAVPTARWETAKENEAFRSEFSHELKLIGLLESNMVTFRMNIQGTESSSFRLLHEVSLWNLGKCKQGLSPGK